MITQAVQAAVAATAASMSNLPTNQNANANAPVTKQAKQLLRGTIPSIKFVRVYCHAKTFVPIATYFLNFVHKFIPL